MNGEIEPKLDRMNGKIETMMKEQNAELKDYIERSMCQLRLEIRNDTLEKNKANWEKENARL